MAHNLAKLSFAEKRISGKPLYLQGVPTQTCILHFALAGRNMQATFGLKVVWES